MRKRNQIAAKIGLNKGLTPTLTEFQRPHFPPPPSQKSNLESILESVLLAQQEQDEYIKQLASRIDLVTTHNKMLESQIA